MRLAFDPDQPHQREAIAAVVDLLRGSMPVPTPVTSVGGVAVVGNRLDLSPSRFAANLQRVQRRGGLEVDPTPATLRGTIDGIDGPREVVFPNVSVEMETGTGKTYVFVRTALELARRNGLRKFVVVVPTVAVREGVLKTLQITRDHLHELYPDVPYRFFAWHRERPAAIDRFARSGTVEIMVLTIDAFTKDSNVLRRPSDRFGGVAPIDRVRATRPVLVLDEPHHLESALRVQALCELDPVLALRYGATHRRHYSRVHRLTAAQAQARGLVKSIEVRPGASADADRQSAFSSRIRATIETHLRRQAELQPRGIKVLSLFFVDRVDSYAAPDGLVRTLFDRHFDELKRGHPRFADLPAEAVRAAYFAERRRRGGAEAIDSRSGESLADAEAYRLIMRDKERLLSLAEPVAFVFSHSALREGWDNPNVLQICALTRSRSAIKKRQEIGRGIRLCVDRAGRRVHDPAVNVLQVVAHESYEDWLGELQTELDEAGIEPDARPRSRPVGTPRPEIRDVPAAARSRPVHAELLAAARAGAVRRLGEADPDSRSEPGPLPDLVGLVAARLQSLSPTPAIGRASILGLLEGVAADLPDPRILVDDPSAVAEAVAAALAEAPPG